MILCFLDIETTGLDFEKDKITELAYVIQDMNFEKPYKIYSQFLFSEDYPAITEEINVLTGITDYHLQKAGVQPATAFFELERDLKHFEVDFIIAHNGANFDRPFLLKKLLQEIPESESEKGDLRGFLRLRGLPWLDTQHDVVYPDSFTSRRLTHLAAEYGFLNPFPHNAIFDVFTMMKVFANQDCEDMIARSLEPWVVLQAHTSYDERELAKKRRFRWESLGDKVYPKMWVKRVKKSDVDKEIKDAPFTISIVESET